MASVVNTLAPLLANASPGNFLQERNLRQAQLGLSAAQQQQIMQQTQLGQQQTQGAALQNQLIQQQITDQKAIGAAWAGWDPTNDPSGKTLIQKAISNGATPARVMEVQQHMAQYNANLANADKVTLENSKARNDDFAGKIQAIIEADPQDQDGLISSYKSALLADDPRAQIPDHFGLNEYKSLQKVHQYQSQQIEQALNIQKTKEAAANEARATEETRKAKLTNDLIEKSQQGGDPGELTGGVHPIAAIGQGLPPNDPTMLGLKNMYDQGGKMPILENGLTRYPMREKAMDAMATYVKSIGEATNKQIQQGKADTAGKEAEARGPFETQTAVNTEKQKIKLQQTLSPDAFAGIPSPQVRAQAERAYQDYSNKYIDSMEAAQGLRDLISQAQHGNKAAPGLVSIAELRTYLNRVTTPELRMVGGAGNLIDKVEGVLGGLGTGQPIPPDIMQGMDQIGAMQQQNSQRKYVNQVGLMKTTYGAAPPLYQWQPHSGQQGAQPGAGGGLPRVATPADVAKLPKGTHFLDPNGIERVVP